MKSVFVLALVFFTAAQAFAAAPKAYKPDANAPRSSVPEEYRWDLTNVFKDDAAWESGFADAKAKLGSIAVHKGKLTAATEVRSCLDDYFALRGVTDRIASYANHSAVVDDGVAKYQEFQQRSLALQNDFRSGTSFIRQELLRLDDRTAAPCWGTPRWLLTAPTSWTFAAGARMSWTRRRSGSWASRATTCGRRRTLTRCRRRSS